MLALAGDRASGGEKVPTILAGPLAFRLLPKQLQEAAGIDIEHPLAPSVPSRI